MHNPTGCGLPEVQGRAFGLGGGPMAPCGGTVDANGSSTTIGTGASARGTIGAIEQATLRRWCYNPRMVVAIAGVAQVDGGASRRNFMAGVARCFWGLALANKGRTKGGVEL